MSADEKLVLDEIQRLRALRLAKMAPRVSRDLRKARLRRRPYKRWSRSAA